MQTLGQRLRAEREKKGLSIPELAGRTRIRAMYFEAIEADRPEQFPGRFFYRSFLRQYAGLLELPESAVQPEIERSILDEQAETREREAVSRDFKPEVPPLPTGRVNLREETRRWVIRLSGLVGVVVLCSIVYFVWQGWGQRFLDENWRRVVAHRAQSAPQPRHVAQQPAPTALNQTQAGQPQANATQPPVATPDAATRPVSESGASTTQPTGSAATSVDSPPPGVKARGSIEIRATGDSWVSGWRDNRMFLAITLRTGDARVIEGGGVVRLQFGSSGDVTIKVDGKELPPIGAKGEVRSIEYRNGAYRLLDRTRPAEQKQ